MMINKFFRVTFNIAKFAYSNGKKRINIVENNIIKQEQLVHKINTHKDKAMQIYEEQPDIDLANQVKKLNLKDFSVRVHHLLKQKQKSVIFWSSVQNEFLERLKPTTDPVKIRSYSKILYSLSKSKKSTANYETKMSIILPFATPQSFTTIVTSLSRIAPFSQQMSYLIQKFYYKRKSQLRPRQIVAVNYSLSNNGRQCDKQMISYLDSFNAVQTITMLRSYDKSGIMTQEILKKSLIKLQSLQNQFNVLDLSDMINIYLKYAYITPQLQDLMKNSYGILKRNINDICIQKIWLHIPETINKGKLKIKFIQEIISTIQILRKSQNMSEIIWKNIQPTFKNIENIELKLRLQKIY